MAKKKPTSNRKTPRKQRDGRAAVVGNPNMPRMEAGRPRRIGGRIVTMSDEPEPSPIASSKASTSKVKGNVMKPVPKRRTKAQKPARLGDQVPAREAPDPKDEGPGYIALRVRAKKGELQVQGAKFVEGPLQSTEAVSPGLTYEAKIGRRRVAHGDVPDSVEWRSHPDPEGRAGLDGHHIAERPSFDFAVRIPADQLKRKSLEELRVNLYRWRGQGPGEHVAMSALRRQPKAALQTLATLRGVVVKDLPKGLQRDVRKALDQAVR